MAENDVQDFDSQDDTDTVGDSQLVKDLRRQIKAANKELNELRPYRDQRVLQQAGFDPDSKQGKALLRLHDGDLTPDALKATAEEYGFDIPSGDTGTDEPVDEVAQARSEAIGRTDELRNAAQPVGTQKIGWNDYQQMMGTNPDAAAEALQSGQVDLPPHVAAVINANRVNSEQKLA